MPKSNEDLMFEKVAARADLAMAEITAGGGVLQPEQANQFIDYVESEPTMVQQMRVVRMNSPQRKINRMGFGERILRAARQAGGANDDGSNDRYLTEAERAKPNFSEIELTTKEMMAEVHIGYEMLEDNLEREGFEDHLIQQVGAQVSRDLEEWVLEADTNVVGDDFLALNDGALVSSTSHIVDAGGDRLNPDIFEEANIQMPEKYFRRMNEMKYFIGKNDSVRYRGNVAKRATGYGDSMLTSNGELYAYGIRAEVAALMPASYGLFTFPQNMILGIQRQITMEMDRDIRARQIIMVVTLRVDFKYDDEDAVVKFINLG